MALSRHHAAITRPLNVQEIVTQAQDFDYNPERDLQAWLRSARMLLTEAGICEQDGNLQMAYLYLYRHAELIIGKLSLHPQAKNPRFKEDLNQARKTVNKNLVKLEQWKPRINQEHQRYVKAMERRNAEKQRIYDEQRTADRNSMLDGSYRRPSFDQDQDLREDFGQTLDAREHRQLAVDLARQELRRRDVNRQTTRQAGISPRTVASRRKGIIIGPPDGGDDSQDPSQYPENVSEGVREAGAYLHQQGQESQDARKHSISKSQTFNYPSVPPKEASMRWSTPPIQPERPRKDYGAPPALPAKATAYEDAPPLPAKHTTNDMAEPQVHSVPQPLASKVTFKPNAYTEGGAPLRTVFLPPALRTTFLNLADRNTARNLETCGILCGTVVSNALFISHLVIPDQQSTSDTCDTTEEGDNELFDYCDSNDLLVCGWIHTHPSQTCFLSSRDLHTSSGYQIMLPEAIAIVCAPRHDPDWGIFRLTDPPGLPAVLNCTQKGLFHPHAESNLYTDALRPGHVVEGPGLKFQTVDMRKC